MVLAAGKVRIRPPRPTDAGQLAGLNRELGYAAESREIVSRIKRVSRLPEHFIAVAEIESVVIGWVQAEHRFSLETGEKAELVGLVVGARARRGGKGARASGRGMGGRSRIKVDCRSLQRRAPGVTLL